MEDNGVIVIVVYYGRKWTQKDNGGWVFQNYRLEVIDIKDTFTFADISKGNDPDI